MDDPFVSHLPIDEIKEALQNQDSATAAAMIQNHLDKQNNIPLNIGITGESGSGKSTFVNAIRGIDSRDERAALTGCVETTTVVTPYPHPNYPNVTFWDLPGIGTMNFPADKYLQEVGFEKYDFFIIISADRFRENDVKLAKEIQKMEKMFYFVRSKIDHNVRDEERSQRDFNLKVTLDGIRQNCVEGLQKQGFKAPQVFLVSSFELHMYDFHQLEETLERELPAHKKNALLMAMPNISRGIIDKKKEALHTKIKYLAFVSAFIASAPVPGLSIAADLSMLVSTVVEYQVTFGLDNKSLQSLADSANVSFNDLRAVMKSPLSATKITTELIVKVLSLSVSEAALIAAEEGSRMIPVFGIPVAMTFSFLSTYRALSTFLNMLADDAQSVFTRALGLDTSV
ncbi:Interferon-inducible GTPase 5 [Channa argus]|uniref:Interferon-inducible GTPase 5 n=1 Tax=Channa argus TaxID=215402 RepID=A0A6G1QH00_CHAAH|nr:Interferon-inducible GTPase 5 [Channa argus]KAK2891491.1 hypothetical protein Q8A73_017156 [Channa argus]